MAEELPKQIGRYVVDGRLGQGAMGVIFRAHDPAIERAVAIKLVRTELLADEDREGYVQRFAREAVAAGRCQHANIVSVFDVGVLDGDPYMVMEFVDGVTLSQLLRQRGRLDLAAAVSIGGQMLDGLAAAHEEGIVHRDVKPANVMVTRNGRVKVADFGISRVGSVSLTHTGAMVGTPSYMSPEQCRGAAVDARSDIFSAGALLFEMLSGDRPFPGGTAHEIWFKLMNDPPQDLLALCPGLPPAVADTVLRALAKSPEARFASAGEMAAALRAGAADAGGDHTVVARPQQPRPAQPGFQVDETTAAALARHLALHVGPIAQKLVSSAIREAGSLDALYDSLARRIDSPADRERFLQQAKQTTASGIRPMPGLLAPEVQERVARALAAHLGPVAAMLVRREAPGCADLPSLARRLAPNIDSAKERAAFLETLGV